MFLPNGIDETQILFLVDQYMFKVKNKKTVDVMVVALYVFNGNSKGTRTTVGMSF